MFFRAGARFLRLVLRLLRDFDVERAQKQVFQKRLYISMASSIALIRPALWTITFTPAHAQHSIRVGFN